MSRRSLHWERGLKQSLRNHGGDLHRRSLHWERGLKLLVAFGTREDDIVAPFIGSVD